VKDCGTLNGMNDPAVLVEGLAKRFGDVVALSGIDFEIPRGTVLGLLGPNGAGKTTAVRILTTILWPDDGRATILGRDVVSEADAVRSLIGLAGQYAAVDENLTGSENLRLVGHLTHQRRATIGPRAVELLERFGLAEAASRPVRTYSGGMRRRLDLAAALVHRPPVLFLDEPTTGLDPRGRNDLWDTIGELVSDGTTLLLTTQYLEEAEHLADQIVVIDHGSVIGSGTPRELKSRFAATIVEIEFDSPADAQTAVARVAERWPAAVLDGGRTAEITVRDGGRDVLAVVRSIDGGDLAPLHLTVREPTLDDVFLQLTGRHHDGEDDKAANDGDDKAANDGDDKAANDGGDGTAGHNLGREETAVRRTTPSSRGAA
jgi:daunorubicin resistance ABC transporter ATP-binding subunit